MSDIQALSSSTQLNLGISEYPQGVRGCIFHVWHAGHFMPLIRAHMSDKCLTSRRTVARAGIMPGGGGACVFHVGGSKDAIILSQGPTTVQRIRGDTLRSASGNGGNNTRLKHLDSTTLQYSVLNRRDKVYQGASLSVAEGKLRDMTGLRVIMGGVGASSRLRIGGCGNTTS